MNQEVKISLPRLAKDADINAALLMEINKVNAQSQKDMRSDIERLMEATMAYGVEIDEATGQVKRIGNMDMHRGLPIQSKMRGCLLNDDGTVAEYLPADSWLDSTRDGSAGQVMVEIPEHYRMFRQEPGKKTVLLSEHPLEGFHKVERVYVGAYNACCDAGRNRVLCSVLNLDANHARVKQSYNPTFPGFSKNGRPWTHMTLADYEASAVKRGPGWHMMMYDIWKTITWLCVVEYATLDIQQPYQSKPDSGGLKQGGLGGGLNCYINYDWGICANYPVLPIGYTDEYGNNSVGQQCLVTKGETVNIDTQVPRYRGIDNLYGDVSCLVGDMLVLHNHPVISGPTFNVQFWKCKDYSKISLTKNNSYSLVNQITLPSSPALMNTGFCDILFGKEGDILFSDVNSVGKATFPDNYVYQYHYNCGTYNWYAHGLSFGGSVLLQHDSKMGLFARMSYPTNIGDTANHYNTGTRLCFIPSSIN